MFRKCMEYFYKSHWSCNFRVILNGWTTGNRDASGSWPCLFPLLVTSPASEPSMCGINMINQFWSLYHMYYGLNTVFECSSSRFLYIHRSTWKPLTSKFLTGIINWKYNIRFRKIEIIANRINDNTIHYIFI